MDGFIYWNQLRHLIIQTRKSELSSSKSQSRLKFSHLSYSQTRPKDNEILKHTIVTEDLKRRHAKFLSCKKSTDFLHALNLSRKLVTL